MTLNRRWIPSPCYSSRGGASVRLIVLHTAEGARNIDDLGHYFQNSANQVSSHVGADNQKGVIGEYVTRGNKAWTCANYNPVAVQLELCAFSAWSRDTWLNDNRTMLENCAKWIAEEAKHYGIPITALSDSQAQGNGRGVCQHKNLGAGGGGHVNCGPGFPMDKVLEWARNGTPSQPITTEEDELFYLQFKPGNNDASLSFTNEQSNGNYRVRFVCRVEQNMTLDFWTGPNQTIKAVYGETAGATIPKGCKGAVVHLNPPCDLTEPVAVSIGKT